MTVLVVNPSPDVYGADLQMLQTVTALGQGGFAVVVALPADGELVARLRTVGAEVTFLDFPVLRKGNASVAALLKMVGAAVGSLPRSVRLIRRLRPEAVIVNTVTLPWWLLASRLTRTPTIAHLHEAETEARRFVRRALVAPLFLADAVIVISEAARNAMTEAQPRLARRARLIYNGVPQPGEVIDSARSTRSGPTRLAVVGRLSPRKGSDVALEAVGLLRRSGLDVSLEIAGTSFTGYDWFETQLRERAKQDDLAGAVVFSGYCNPIWPVFGRADIVLAPSLHEPFGNAVVEAQMVGRPVVAAAALGHLESVSDGRTGLLVEPGNPQAMADAVRRLIDDPSLADRLTERARSEAIRRFSVDRYAAEVVSLLRLVTRSSG